MSKGTLLLIVLVAFVVWALAGGRPLFRSSGGNIQATVEDAGEDLKSAGRDVASSIRRTVQ